MYKTKHLTTDILIIGGGTAGPLWFWNGKPDAEKTKGMVAACKSAGYYGMGILPCNGMGVDFMGPEFLKQYKIAVDEAGKLGMKMCLYDTSIGSPAARPEGC